MSLIPAYIIDISKTKVMVPDDAVQIPSPILYYQKSKSAYNDSKTRERVNAVDLHMENRILTRRDMVSPVGNLALFMEDGAFEVVKGIHEIQEDEMRKYIEKEKTSAYRKGYIEAVKQMKSRSLLAKLKDLI